MEATVRRTMIATACILMAAPALGQPAFAQSVGEKTGVNSVLGVSPSTEDFVKQVAISDMFEIEASKLAQQKGTAEEKTFASQMVRDHTICEANVFSSAVPFCWASLLRSEEHTSELQSQFHLVCRLLLEKK